MSNPVDAARNALWKLGVRGWRLARRVNFLVRAEPAVWAVARAIAGKPTDSETAISLPHGTTLVSPSGYRDIRTLAAGMYEPEVTRLFEAILREGMFVFDVGAYIGYYSVLASRLVGPRGRVYAFEPNGTAANYLRRNLNDNLCTNSVAIEKAVLDGSGRSSLAFDPAGAESYVTEGETEDMPSSRVAAVSLDDFARDEHVHRVDLIKMDIEGSEERALRGMSQLSESNPNLFLVMEFNTQAMTRAGIGRDQMRSLLVRLGFTKGEIIEQGMGRIVNDILPSTNAVCNVLFTK